MEYNLVDVIANYASYAIFAALFIFLFKWILRHFKETRTEYIQLLNESTERERKYQDIIEKLSNELPEIKSSLQEIERRMNK